MRALATTFFLALLTLTACSSGFHASDNSGPHLCTEQLSFGLTIGVKVPSGETLPPVDQFTVTVSDGSYVQHFPMQSGDPAALVVIAQDSSAQILIAGAPERAGTYDVSISHPDYEPVHLTGVSSQDSDGCGVVPGTLSVTLTKK